MEAHRLQIIALAGIIGFLIAPFSTHARFDNSDALKGVENVFIYFDVSLKDDDVLVFRMELVDKTIKQLEEAGRAVTAIVGFRGKASRFITKDEHYVLQEEIGNKKKIHGWVTHFTSKGVVVEQCAIAAEILDIPPEDFLPEIKIVENGYISLVGYQAQGYAVIPMD